jgi:hypothetical protein
MPSAEQLYCTHVYSNRREKMFCQVTMEVLDSKELNPEDMESEVEYWEAPMDEAAVKSSETLKKQHGGQHPAAG